MSVPSATRKQKRIPFVGKRFTPAEFDTYAKSVLLKNTTDAAWRGQYPVLHHTASPSLAMRPNGLTEQHLANLLNEYENIQGWSGAPHLFIDDREDGIIVFQRLDRRGVHAKSFNSAGWGIEMLGDYDTEDPTTGRGAKVLNNAAHALAVLLSVNSGGLSDIKFHRDDPQTSKTCPGSRVTKAMVTRLVSDVFTGGKQVVSILNAEPSDSPASWAASSWEWAEAEGLMSGNPTGPVDRQTLATVLHRYHMERPE